MFHENDNEKYVFAKLAEYTKSNIKPSTVMRVIPVPFGVFHAKMLQHLSALLDKGFIMIHPKFENLINSLRSAVSIDYKLDKTRSAHKTICSTLRYKMKVKKIKDQQKDKVVISDINDAPKEYICSYCNCNTVIRMDSLSLYCNHCHMISLIEDLQEVQQLQEPQTLDNFELAISTTPLPGYGDVAIKKPPVYKGSFESLSEKGIKIKSYDVRDEVGRPIHED